MTLPSIEVPEAPQPRHAPIGVTTHIAGLTDVGRVREHNEDNFIIADLTAVTRVTEPRSSLVGPRGLLFAVCDGMGGAAAGEIASQMAIDVIHGIVQDAGEPPTRDAFAQKLVASVQEAGARIFLAAKSNRSQRGMGTTATVAGVFERTLFVGQVGDSRAYLYRSGILRQLTKDQSLVTKLIEAGQLTEAEAETYEHSHIILQALGTADTVSVDLSFVDICKGDAVLLCSDGLSGLISAEQIREALADTEDPAACCRRLTDAAIESGGHDNITVIVARFDGDVPDPGEADLGVGYQPYVLLEPIEVIPSGRMSASLKIPELPPPGADVKHSVSLPPAAPTDPDDDDDALPNAQSTRPLRVARWVLAATIAVLFGSLGWYVRHQHHEVNIRRPPTAETVRGSFPQPSPTVIPAVSDDASTGSSGPDA